MTDLDDLLDDLSVPARPLPEPAPAALSRRRFLQVGAAGAGAVALTPYLSSLEALAAPPVEAGQGILVLVMLGGGNDGLHTLVPVGDGHYHDLRGPIAFDAGDVHRVGGGAFGLHPSLSALGRRYDRGDVAIVRGVGYRPADLSHFESMGIWMQGWGGADGGAAGTGWVGRYLDGLPDAARQSLYGAVVGSSVPLHMLGRVSHAAGLPSSMSDAFGADRDDPSDARMFDTIAAFGQGPSGLGDWGDAYGDTAEDLMDLVTRLGPAYDTELPDSWIGRQLVLAARLVNANLGIRVLGVSLGSFDHHAGQPARHADLLGQLDAAIEAFFRALADRWRAQVTLATFSEFGRRPQVNGDRGTDHGTASTMLLAGDRVDGGLKGVQPGLGPNDLDRHGNLESHVDFRSVYATILDDWLDGDDREVLGARFDKLDLFAAGPGGAPAPAPAPPSKPAPRRRFPDVPAHHFAFSPVSWAVAHRITDGLGDTGRFAPDQPVTRGQLATFMHRMMGRPRVAARHGFRDVARGAFYEDAVAWMKRRAITTGVGGGRRFEPDRHVTRGEVATFLWRMAGRPRVSAPHGFTDVPRDAFYEPAVRWLRRHKITTGVGGSNRFAPDASVTRAEVVTFLHRLAGKKAAWGGGVSVPPSARF